MPSVNNPPPKTKHIAPDDMQTPKRPSKQYGNAPTGRSGASNSSVLTSGGERTPATSNTFRHLIHSKRRPIEETPTRKPSNAPKSRPVGKPAGASSETTFRNASTPIKDQLKRMNADELGELLREIHKTQKQHDEDSGTPSPVKVNNPGSSNAIKRRRIDSDEENSPESSDKPVHRAKIIKAGQDTISVIRQARMGDDSDVDIDGGSGEEEMGGLDGGNGPGEEDEVEEMDEGNGWEEGDMMDEQQSLVDSGDERARVRASATQKFKGVYRPDSETENRLANLEDDVKDMRKMIGDVHNLLLKGHRPKSGSTNHSSPKTPAQSRDSAWNSAIPEAASHENILDDEEILQMPKVKKAKIKDEDPGKNKRDVVLSAYTREILLNLMGATSCSDFKEPLPLKDGKPVFWEKIGKKTYLRPVWGATFGINYTAKNSWCNKFVEECKKPGNMTKGNKAYLSSITGQEFLDSAAQGAFSTISQLWRSHARGTAKEDEQWKKYTRRQRSRRVALAEKKDKGRQNTPLADKKYNWTVVPECQSAQHSDAEDDSRYVVEEPIWRSELANKFSDILRVQGAAKAGTSASPNTKANRIYIRVDSAIPDPGNGLTIGEWAINPAWKKAFPDDYEAASLFIVEEEPPKIDKVAARLGRSLKQREYVDVRPPTKNPLPERVVLLPLVQKPDDSDEEIAEEHQERSELEAQGGTESPVQEKGHNVPEPAAPVRPRPKMRPAPEQVDQNMPAPTVTPEHGTSSIPIDPSLEKPATLVQDDHDLTPNWPDPSLHVPHTNDPGIVPEPVLGAPTTNDMPPPPPLLTNEGGASIENGENEERPKRKRGRPKKVSTQPTEEADCSQGSQGGRGGRGGCGGRGGQGGRGGRGGKRGQNSGETDTQHEQQDVGLAAQPSDDGIASTSSSGPTLKLRLRGAEGSKCK